MGGPAAAPWSLLDEGATAAALDDAGVQHSAVHSATLRSVALARILATGAIPALATLADVEGIPAGALAALEARGCVVASSRVEEQRTSSDGSTTKLLLRLHDGLAVEAVLLRHDSSAGRYADGPRPGSKRSTLCVSSQAGCAMGCKFCATATMGLQRNLSAGEIIEQAAHALVAGGVALRNVVFMGMGEPMNNYAAVIAAIRVLTASPRHGGLGLARGRVTVSTVGVVPRMLTLAADAPGVRLALSLHAPSQAEREAIVPSASTFALPRLLEAAQAFAAAPGGSSPLIEYVLLRGVNDTLPHAHALGRLLAGRGWPVNLIPFNRVPSSPYEPPAVADVVAFQNALRSEHGIFVTVRRTMGKDITGACGQLAVANKSGAVADIEDVVASAGRSVAAMQLAVAV